jgi:hypothetical protein
MGVVGTRLKTALKSAVFGHILSEGIPHTQGLGSGGGVPRDMIGREDGVARRTKKTGEDYPSG